MVFRSRCKCAEFMRRKQSPVIHMALAEYYNFQRDLIIELARLSIFAYGVPGNHSGYRFADLYDFHLPIEHYVEWEYSAEGGGRHVETCKTITNS